MEIFKRALCFVCRKKKYIKFMILTPIKNANNESSHCCNSGPCLRKLKLSIEYQLNYHKNKIEELNKLKLSIEKESGRDKNQLTIN